MPTPTLVGDVKNFFTSFSARKEQVTNHKKALFILIQIEGGKGRRLAVPPWLPLSGGRAYLKNGSRV